MGELATLMDGSLAAGVMSPLEAGLPRQDYIMIMRHAERFRRAAEAHRPWAEKGKECVDFFEGRQWSQADLQKLESEGRPALVINKLQPLVKLVVGYHLNNQTDIKYLPGNDGTGTADIARVLSQISKQIDDMNQLKYVSSEVFLDGLLTGRGFYDTRMDFSRNMFGSTKIEAADPFSVYPDPDGQDYDLNKGNSVIRSNWLSIDEVEEYYGALAASYVRPLTNGMTFSQVPSSLYEGQFEVTPWRRFGGDVDGPQNWLLYGDQFYNWIDTYRKTIRMIDIQHYVRCRRWFFVDTETGEQRPVADDWGPDRVQKVLAWARRNGEPLILQQKLARRLRWTHMVGDVMVFDQWSPYDTFTITPYFPYFRRGQTQGMVEHLLDPQREINVRRSARQNIVGRSSNGGWKYEKGSLTPQERTNLETNGGRPGFTMEYDRKNGTLAEPTQIQPGQSPVSVEQLEKEAENDIKQIAGINDSALGQVDQATISGRAIQARQQQSVIGLEGFMSNYHRTQQMLGMKTLEVVQQHYTEKRVIRTIGPAANPIETVINQASADGVINNISLGSFVVDISETSLSDSFLAGQFNELVQLKGLGMPIPDDFLIDASSVGRKEEMRIAVAQQRQAQAANPGPPGAPAGPGPGGSQVGPDGGSMKSGPEAGAPAQPPSPMGPHG
jgi:hypothetical protein